MREEEAFKSVVSAASLRPGEMQSVSFEGVVVKVGVLVSMAPSILKEPVALFSGDDKLD